MPRVPTYTSNVQQRAIPNVQQQGTNNVDAFGAATGRALSQIGQGASNLGGALEKIELEHREREDTQAARDAYLKYSDQVRGYLHDPKEGIYARQGRDASGITKDSMTRFDEFDGEATKGLTTRQVEKFKQLSFGLRKNSLDGISRHESAQFRAQENSTDDAIMADAIKGGVTSYTDPETVNMYFDQGLEAVKAKAARNGASAEITQAAVDKYKSSFHSAVVDRIMVESPAGAKAYYDANKDDIDGLARTKIETSLKTGLTKQYAQAATDSIIAQGLSVTESLTKARAINDPDVRDEAVSRIKQRFNEKNIAEKEAASEAWKIVTRDKSTDGIPPAMLQQIPANTLVSMENAAKSLREGKPPSHNPEKWYEFNRLVQRATTGDKAARKEIIQMDMYSKLYSHLDNAHFDQAIAAQNAFIKNDVSAINKARSGAGNIISNKQAADGQLNILFGAKSNKNRDPKEREFAAQFYQLLQEEVEQWSLDNNGKKIPATERDRIIRELTQSVTQEGLIFDSDIDVTDIPAGVINEIADNLRSKGKPVNGRTLVTAYLAAKEKGLVD